MKMEWNGFLISDDPRLLNVETVVQFLGKSYWANKRSRERIDISIANSLCFGVYEGARQVGFARVVTDHATMYWLCDVFIDESCRGKGIGKKLVESITQSDELKDLMGLLGTMDAHDLYRQYHFEDDKERMMRRMPDYVRAMRSLKTEG
ncbi:GNAT family N-acetyltransferase [Paenibacillus ferrarius]|uniref:GNAT family N-acetyltransferase n=1 Tax=Paenibacillus ferrarius TaxID=1469647 RepID=UPI003D2963F5